MDAAAFWRAARSGCDAAFGVIAQQAVGEV
jgi:hypothetical protein